MQMPILKSEERVFRDPYIFAADLKSVTLDNVLVNLFMLMRNNGARITLRLRQGTFHEIRTLKEFFKLLEERGEADGFTVNPEATESWLRSSLVNMINCGKPQENVMSMRPLHLESYRIRNQKFTRDYFASNQVYCMLKQRREVLDALKTYLMIGWDNATRRIVDSPTLDVDTAGVLHLIKLVEIDTMADRTTQPNIPPVLTEQADLFCDDIMRLLAYQRSIPRSVFIEYLRILIGFHLTLYFQKLIYLLPKMVNEGCLNVEDNWSLVVDMTDKLDSVVSPIACMDMEKTINGMIDYVRASYTIHTMRKINNYDCYVEQALDMINNPTDQMNAIFEVMLQNIYDNYRSRATTDAEREEAEQNIRDLQEYLRYENSPLEKYVQCWMCVGATYQIKFGLRFLDKVSMKNEPSALILDGKSRKHPRRGAIGSKLLEVLVQLLVLEPREGGGLESKPLSIRQLATKIRNRYGLIIDGTDEPRFENADIKTLLAFKQNMDALRNKLRQIGFYTDLSDASSLQKIRPRYNFND